MVHDPLFVIASIVFAIIGSSLSIMMLGRALVVPQRSKPLWVVLTGIVAGMGIWSAHFIAVLGISSLGEQRFYLQLSFVALIVTTVLVTLGFKLSASSRGRSVELGGLVIGSAIVGNHALTLASINGGGVDFHAFDALAVAVVWGLLMGVLTTNRRIRRVTRYCGVGSAVSFAMGIIGVHYLSMSGLRIDTSVPAWFSASGVPDRYMLSTVVLFGTMILGVGFVVFSMDRQHARDRVQALEHMAYHDPLTGLPNRALMELRLREAIASDPSRVAAVTFDLNRFRNVNDVYGHETGDAVLKAVAQNLVKALKGNEVVGRTGGDEFLALSPYVGDANDAFAFALRMQEAVTSVADVEGVRINVGSSVGIARGGFEGVTATEVMGRAELAMNRARRHASDEPLFYDPDVDEPNRQKSQLQLDMHSALQNDEFELLYQRQNRLSDGLVVGYEVLIRWNHPRKGLISPDLFIPMAERDGLIVAIGEWVLRRACLEAVSWETPAKIAVNVAARQMMETDLPEVVRMALKESGLPPSRLELEITESGFIPNMDVALATADKLKAMGISLAMDDFGTGYASLASLQALPFNKIKIDKSFLREMESHNQAGPILEAAISLGQRLGIAVLVEGIETKAEADFIQSAGCNLGQGFFYGKPLSSHAFETKNDALKLHAAKGGMTKNPEFSDRALKVIA